MERAERDRNSLRFSAPPAWRPEAPAAIPCSQWREMKDSNPRSWFWRPASWPLNESPANFMAVATGVEPVFPDRQSGVLAARPCDRLLQVLAARAGFEPACTGSEPVILSS